MYPIFIGKLIADFIQFCSVMAKFLFLQKWYWALDYVCTQFRDFTKILSFFKLFDNSWGNSYFQFVVIMI